MEGRGGRRLMLRMMLARRVSSSGRDLEWLSFLGVLFSRASGLVSREGLVDLIDEVDKSYLENRL